MKQKLLILAAAVMALGCIGTLQAFTNAEQKTNAQTANTPQEIRGIIVDEHDSLWYARQQQLWLEQAQANPTDEHAWQQAFEAARYTDMLQDEYGYTPRKQAVLDQMKQHIPGSFVYNLCMFMTEREMRGGNPTPYAGQALQTMPENIGRKDAETLIGYLYMTGKTFNKDSQEYQQMSRLAKRLYTTNAYPSYLLRYTYNTLQGLDENAIFFVNGDVPAFSSLILQEGLGVHTDKLIVPISFLYVDDFRKALCNYFGFSDFEITKDYANIENWSQVYEQDLLEHIIRHTKRPVYFFPYGYPDTESFKKNLYNEGLALRYSTKRYDNMIVAKRNVEERYDLHYLIEPQFVCEEQWQGSERIQLNYMVMLAPVVKSYKAAGDTLRANRLMRYLTTAVINTSLSDEKKMEYINLLGDTKK